MFKHLKTKRTHYETNGWDQEKKNIKNEKNEHNSKNVNLFEEAEKNLIIRF